jgi:hypothetical protein
MENWETLSPGNKVFACNRCRIQVVAMVGLIIAALLRAR